MGIKTALKGVLRKVHDPVDYRKQAKEMGVAGRLNGPDSQPADGAARREIARVEGETYGRSAGSVG